MTWGVPVVVGLLVGLLMGSLGGGGGIIAVPALIHLMGQDPHQATTTSLVVVLMTSVVGIVQHGRAGRVAWSEGLVFGVLTVGGAAVGSVWSARVPPQVLMLSLGALLVAVAGLMARRAAALARAHRAGPTSSDAVTVRRPLVSTRPLRVDLGRLPVVVAVATGAGVLTGFFGVGGGFAVVPALTLVLALPMARAVGTSLLVMVVTAAASLAVRGGTEGLQLDWPLTLTFGLCAMGASVAGVRLAGGLAAHRQQAAFAVLLVVVAVITTAQAVV
ncbi:sulfite exporter TauE/SafE family protein [Kytococcus sedentarius]|uniref:sulfite exporter TauE/SafE family protein n=1 Tax=Kytococcus sedentarius TaxID=1276 RepID=UPI0035BC3FB9